MTLLNEDFSGDIAARWVNLTPDTATNRDPDILGSPPHGNPSPGLWLHPGWIQSIDSYPSDEFTFSIDARFDSGGGVVVALHNLNSDQQVAHIRILPDLVTYSTNPNGSYTNGRVNMDAEFHHYELKVDASGDSEWRRDGILQKTGTGFPLVNLVVKIYNASGTAPTYSGHADNVRFTVP